MPCAPFRLAFAVGLLVQPVPALAQLLEVKTVPLASGDQFVLFPSATRGMGSVALALDDSLGDPFANPATAARMRTNVLFASPTFYSISQHAGSAHTLPVGAVLAGGRSWFGAAAVALQRIQPGEAAFFPQPLWEGSDIGSVWPAPQPPLSRGGNNLYGFGALGRRLAGGRIAVALSVEAADYNAMDGVEHLYGFAQSIDQFGSSQDLRLGIAARLDPRSRLEAVVLHNRFAMTHDVTYLEWVVIDSTTWTWEPRERVVTNDDRTDTWGAHARYTRTFGQGWRLGAALTGNWKDHRAIPNYEIVNIPRDPGKSWAYALGLGVARRVGPARFGLDVVYEPIRSHTWATTDTAIGGAVAPGEMTVENRFRFSNAAVRVGAAREVGIAGFSLGLEARSIDYRLRQWDHVSGSFRQQTESWMEWTPTWGGEVRFAEFEIAYRGRLTTGTGRPGVAWTKAVAERFADASQAADIVVAPGGPLTLQEATVVTHQFYIVVPIR